MWRRGDEEDEAKREREMGGWGFACHGGRKGGPGGFDKNALTLLFFFVPSLLNN